MCTAVFILDELRSVAEFTGIEFSVAAGVGTLEDAFICVDLATGSTFEIAGFITGAVGRASLDVAGKCGFVTILASFHFAIAAGGGGMLDAPGFVHLAVIGAFDGTRNIGRGAPFDAGCRQDIVAVAVFGSRVGNAIAAVGTWGGFTAGSDYFAIGIAGKRACRTGQPIVTGAGTCLEFVVIAPFIIVKFIVAAFERTAGSIDFAFDTFKGTAAISRIGFCACIPFWLEFCAIAFFIIRKNAVAAGL